MARRKPDPQNTLAITDLDGADAVLVELAKVDRDISMIEICMNEDLETVRKRADEVAAPYREKRKQLEAALTTYATAGKKTLFEKARSLKLMHGVIGFRASDELKPLPKVTWASVLEKVKAMADKLKELELPNCIRAKEEPDKDVLRKLPEDLRTEAGVRIVPKDTFYYETKEETVAEKAA
jgi:phage host-nuclease inhibitor protein Gam